MDELSEAGACVPLPKLGYVLAYRPVRIPMFDLARTRAKVHRFARTAHVHRRL